LFTQNVLGFSPTATGLVLLPGGLATAVSAMICGRILSAPRRIIDPRLLVLFGVAVFTLSMWQLGHLSIASGEPDTRLALIIRGFGLGFLFTPLNNVLFATLRGPEVAQGSSFLNLCRQLGGSFGIAVLNTYITNQTEFHRYDLVSHLTSGDPQFLERQQAIMSNLITHGLSPVSAQAAALAQISATVQAQASVMAYNDGFLLLGLCFILVTPAILLLRAPKPGAPADAGGH
jgi:DHA2 family multidrug resistance protein